MCENKLLCGIVVLVVGILFLLKDLNVWGFWGITPWTAVFVLVGLAMMCKKGKKK